MSAPMTSIKDALERIIQIYERNIGRQNEKLADIPLVAHRALATLTTPAPGRDALRERIEEILQATKRNPLMVGFVYSRPTVKELQERLDLVAELTRTILSALPVAPVVDEAAIRTDEREKCARVAESPVRQEEWPRSVGLERTSPTYLMQQTIAQAIRAGGGER